MNLFWVENHRQFSQVAQSSFLSAHTVTLAPSLAAARDALASGRFDAILLDYDLDDGKGTELVAEIKSRPDAPPIIAASSHREGNRRLAEAGADVVCGEMQFAQVEQVLREVREQNVL